MIKNLHLKGISPIIGVILIVSVTVALVTLATIIVFDIGNEVNESTESVVDVSESSTGVTATLIRSSDDSIEIRDSEGEIVESITSPGEEYTISEEGDYSIIAITDDGSEEVIRNINVSDTNEEEITNEDVVFGTVSINPEIEGAEVISRNEEGEEIDSTVTNSDGEYEVQAVKNGELNVNVNGITIEDSDFYANKNKIIQDVGSEINIEFDRDNSNDVTVDDETVTINFESDSDNNKLIGNLYQLQAVQDNLSNDYVLVNDIDASETESWNEGAGFEPLGDSDTQFTGTFDGQGYEIEQLTIDRIDNDMIGLFGLNEGTIKNMVVTDINIQGDNDVGGLVGLNDNNVYQSDVEGTINGGSNVGGLVGHNNEGEIQKSYSDSTVEGDSDIGGLVGLMGLFSDEVRIQDSYAMGEVTGDSNVGGLVGRIIQGNVDSSYATSNINNDGDNTGGLVGFNDGEVMDSYWDIESTGQDEDDSDGSEGLNTEDMQGDSAEDNMVGFDFENIWIPIENDYPELQE